MHPELIKAVKERISLGYSKEAIQAELQGAGYDIPTIEQVYAEARGEQSPSVSNIPAVPDPDQDPAYQSASVYEQESMGQSSSVVTGNTGQLISYSQLRKQTWILCKSKIKTFIQAGLMMAVLFGLSGLLVSYLAYKEFSSMAGPDFDTLFSPVNIIVFILMAFFVTVAFRVVTFAVIQNVVSENKTEKFSKSLSWSLAHIVPVVLLGLYVQFVTQLGYLLFIIPGVAAVGYLLFSSYVLAAGEAKGVPALIRSTELVYGRWWKVFLRFLFLGLIAFLVIFGFLIILMLISAMFSFVPGGDIIAGVLVFLGYAAAMLLGIGYIVSGTALMFHSLRASAGQSVFSESVKKKLSIGYWVFIILGLLLMVVNVTTIPDSLDKMQAEFKKAAESEQSAGVDTKERAEQLRQDISDAENSQ